MTERQAVLNKLHLEFADLTKRFDIEDWRTLRNKDYWFSDTILDEIQRLNYKLVRIRHYDKFGKPLKEDEEE